MNKVLIFCILILLCVLVASLAITILVERWQEPNFDLSLGEFLMLGSTLIVTSIVVIVLIQGAISNKKTKKK